MKMKFRLYIKILEVEIRNVNNTNMHSLIENSKKKIIKNRKNHVLVS